VEYLSIYYKLVICFCHSHEITAVANHIHPSIPIEQNQAINKKNFK